MRYGAASNLVIAVARLSTIGLGGYLAVKGQITLGTFLAFSAYLVQLVAPVRMLSTLLTIGQQARASVMRVFELVDARPVITERPDATTLAEHGPPRIAFDDVTFGYAADRPILRNFDLRPPDAMMVFSAGGHGAVPIDVARGARERGLAVIAKDTGPGIRDVEAALRDGYAGRSGLGLGLPGARRLMDEFEVITRPGRGTTVTMTKWHRGGRR